MFDETPRAQVLTYIEGSIYQLDEDNERHVTTPTPRCTTAARPRPHGHSRAADCRACKGGGGEGGGVTWAAVFGQCRREGHRPLPVGSEGMGAPVGRCVGGAGGHPGLISCGIWAGGWGRARREPDLGRASIRAAVRGWGGGPKGDGAGSRPPCLCRRFLVGAGLWGGLRFGPVRACACVCGRGCGRAGTVWAVGTRAIR
jgi:hypothetical protein